ncbi:MAG: outer membrane beta-barrel protein, partial [Polymorphobacter sp.]
MLRSFTVAAVLATAAVAMPATAAEFGGFRVEAQGGWNSTSIDYTRGGIVYDNSKSSFGYGGEVGYDMPVSETVILGVNANFAGSTQSYTDMLCPEGQSACL